MASPKDATIRVKLECDPSVPEFVEEVNYQNELFRQGGRDQPERRSCPVTELRVAGDDDKPVIEGYAAVFDSLSERMWGWKGEFREKIDPGAFADVLARGPDVRALIDHQTGLDTVGRTKNGSLTLSEDERGLKMRLTPANTQPGRDLLTLVRDGTLDQMSFAFRLDKKGSSWEDAEDGNGEYAIRTIHKVSSLEDVSIVTYPAYPATTAEVNHRERGMSAVESMKEWRDSQAREADKDLRLRTRLDVCR